jgi:hypothetical protein
MENLGGRSCQYRPRTSIIAAMESRLDSNQRELIQRLFAVATMLASEIEEIAVKGQSPELSDKRRTRLTYRLLGKSHDLAALSRSINTVSGVLRSSKGD